MTMYKIVCGKGHNLNELVNRCLYIALMSSDSDSKLGDSNDNWILYPGPLGLYARHCDFYFIDENSIRKFYRDNVRNAMADKDHRPDSDAIKKLIGQLQPERFYSFYINVTENHYQYIADHFPEQYIFTSKLNLQHYNQRHHHLMMEYSIGAAESRDYSKIPTLKDLCQRLLKMDYLEQEIVLPDNFVTIDTNLLLQYNFSELFEKLSIKNPQTLEHKTSILTKVIDQYKLYNTVTHPLLLEINDMSWEQIQLTATKG